MTMTTRRSTRADSPRAQRIAVAIGTTMLLVLGTGLAFAAGAGSQIDDSRAVAIRSTRPVETTAIEPAPVATTTVAASLEDDSEPRAEAEAAKPAPRSPREEEQSTGRASRINGGAAADDDDADDADDHEVVGVTVRDDDDDERDEDSERIREEDDAEEENERDD